MTSVTGNYGYVPPTGTSPTSGTRGTSGAGGAEEGLFPTSGTSEAESAEKQQQRNSLEAQLARYEAQKKQLEQQLAQYQNQYGQLEKRDNALKAQEKLLTGKIADLEEVRKQEEAAAKELKEQYDQDNIKLLDLIKQMNEKIAETTQKSAQAVQEQNKKTEAATTEAFKMYEKGEITEDQIPEYIAKKSGNTDLLKQIASSGLSVIESFNTQIKGIISEMANALNTLSDKKIKIESTTTKIKSTNKELGTIQNERLAVEDEMSEVQGNIDNTNAQIAGVEQNISSTQGAISSLDDPTSGGSYSEPPVVAESNPFVPPASGGDKKTKESPVVTTEIGQASENPFISVTSTIDYTGFKQMLDVLMEQNQTTINNLRTSLNQDQQTKPKKAA